MASSEDLGAPRGRSRLHAWARLRPRALRHRRDLFRARQDRADAGLDQSERLADLAADRACARGDAAARLPGLAGDPDRGLRRQRSPPPASVATSLAIGAGNTIEGLLGAYLINRWSDGKATFDTPAGVARFALLVVPADRAVRHHRGDEPRGRRPCRPRGARFGLADLVARRPRRRAAGHAGDRAVGGGGSPRAQPPQAVRIDRHLLRRLRDRPDRLQPDLRDRRSAARRSASWRCCRCCGRRCAAARATPRPRR